MVNLPFTIGMQMHKVICNWAPRPHFIKEKNIAVVAPLLSSNYHDNGPNPAS